MKSVEEVVRDMDGGYDPVADTFRFIVAFGEANNGVLPIYPEIAQAITLLHGKNHTSRSLVSYYMKQLEEVGDLTIWRNENGRMIPGRYIIHGARWEYEKPTRVGNHKTTA